MKKLNINKDKKNILVSYHPVTTLSKKRIYFNLINYCCFNEISNFAIFES